MQPNLSPGTSRLAKTLTALPGTAYAVHLSTIEAATLLKVKPQTLRAALCRDGHYLGARPIKSANRFLLWSSEEIERLAQGKAITARAGGQQ